MKTKYKLRKDLDLPRLMLGISFKTLEIADEYDDRETITTDLNELANFIMNNIFTGETLKKSQAEAIGIIKSETKFFGNLFNGERVEPLEVLDNRGEPITIGELDSLPEAILEAVKESGIDLGEIKEIHIYKLNKKKENDEVAGDA